MALPVNLGSIGSILDSMAGTLGASLSNGRSVGRHPALCCDSRDGMNNGTLIVAHVDKEPVGGFHLYDLFNQAQCSSRGK